MANQLHAAGLHPGRLGQRRGCSRASTTSRWSDNSLNTLDISATKHRLPPRLLPLGLVRPEQVRQARGTTTSTTTSVALRIGTAFTYAREDRLSDLADVSPGEQRPRTCRTARCCSGPGRWPTASRCRSPTSTCWAVDVGDQVPRARVQRRVHTRWLNKFRADGPLPDELHVRLGLRGVARLLRAAQAAWRSSCEPSFISGTVPRRGRGRRGLNWFPFDTRCVWLTVEVIGIRHSPYQRLYVYSAGQTGLLVPAQFLLRF